MPCINNVGSFDDLDVNLQNIMITIISNENICKLLYYNTPDALDKPIVEDNYNLLNTKFYNQTFIPPTETESTYITIFFDRFDGVDGNPYLKRGRLFINVSTHRNLWNINSGLRVVKIIAEIDKILNKQRVSNSLTKDFFGKMNYRPISELFNSYDIWYTNIDSQ